MIPSSLIGDERGTFDQILLVSTRQSKESLGPLLPFTGVVSGVALTCSRTLTHCGWQEMVAECRAVLPGKGKKGRGRVGGPMHTNDSEGGKARDAQIIRGRLDREALSHMEPEIPVPQVPGTCGGGGNGGEVGPACRERNPWKETGQNL